MNLYSIYFCRIYYEFIIYFANALWNHYIFDEFTMNSLSIREYIFITWFVPRIHYEFIIFSRIYYESTICSMKTQWISYFAISLWIRFLFRKLTINFAKIQCIHYLYFEFSMKHFMFHEFAMNLYFFIFGVFTMKFNYILFRNFTMN